MRALVMSDSHGYPTQLRQMVHEVWKRNPGAFDAYVHCGDGAEDFEEIVSDIYQRDPRARLYRVRGNCDFTSDAPNDAVFELGGCRIFVCHGHRYHVKSGLMYLEYAAAERGCSIALYGHTHVPGAEETGGVAMYNPGAAESGSIAILTVENGKPGFQILRANSW